MIKPLFIATILLVLSACGVAPTPQQEALWGFEGKFSLRSPQKNQSGYIQWQQYTNSYEVKLWGALGIGTTKIYGNSKRILVDNGKQQLKFSTQDTIEIAPGFYLPLGDIGNNADAILLNAEPSNIQHFGANNEWQAKTLRSLSYNDLARPIKVKLENSLQETSITLLMKQWQ